MGFRAPISQLSDIADANALAAALAGQSPSWDGTEWAPERFSPAAILVVDEADTFAEDDVTVTPDDGVYVGDQSVKLKAGASFTRGSDTHNSSDNTSDKGVRCTAHVSIDAMTVRISDNGTGANRLQVKISGGATHSKSISGTAGTVITIDGLGIEAGDTFDVVVNHSSSIDHRAGWRDQSGIFPAANDEFTITHGIDGTGSLTENGAFAFDIVSSVGATEGEATVEWDAPSGGIGSWDVIAYSTVLGDGTVEVDIEDTEGTVYATNVATNAWAAAVPADKNVRLRFRMARPTLNDDAPAVVWCARRFAR